MCSRGGLRLSKIYLLAEGQTEQALVRQLLAPTLGIQGIYLHDVLVGKPGHKGGIRSFESVKGDIKRLLKQENSVSVTTLFDRYRLPSDWPGLAESVRQGNIEQAHTVLCRSMHERLCEEMGGSFRTERFIPYIQFHEIEALLFAKPLMTADLLGNSKYASDLEKAVEEAGGCERINDGPMTAPSKRIEKLFPSYKKGGSINTDLPRICSKIGLSGLRVACPLFNQWIDSLVTLSTSSSSTDPAF